MGTRRQRGGGTATGSPSGDTSPVVPFPESSGTALAALPKSLRGLVNAERARRHRSTDPLKYFISLIPGGQRSIVALLRVCTHDDDAGKVVEAYDDISKRDKECGRVIIVDLLDEIEMSARDFVGLVTRCMYDFNLTIAKAHFSSRYADLMRASMDRAINDPSATREREMHLQAAGHVPTSKGIQIAMQQNNVSSEPAEGEAPALAHTARRIVRDLPG